MYELAHERGIAVPPAWTEVWVNPDPKGATQATGRDGKGRPVQRRLASAVEKSAVEKFARLKAFAKVRPKIMSQVEKDFSVSGAAQVLYLINLTGFRVGGEADTKAEVQAYGATTLTSDHVQIEGDMLRFSFIGKEGVKQEHEVKDAKLAKVLEGKTGKLFDTNARRVLAYVKKYGGPKFKTKDFRTAVATEEALKTLKGPPPVAPPKDEKEKAKKVLEVAKVVARKLGNKPQEARDSYIDPGVFAHAWGG